MKFSISTNRKRGVTVFCVRVGRVTSSFQTDNPTYWGFYAPHILQEQLEKRGVPIDKALIHAKIQARFPFPYEVTA